MAYSIKGRVSTKIGIALTSLYIVLVESIFDESKKLISEARIQL